MFVLRNFLTSRRLSGSISLTGNLTVWPSFIKMRMYRLSSAMEAISSIRRCFLNILVFHLMVRIPWSAVILFISAPKLRVKKIIAVIINTATSIQNMAVLGLWIKSCSPTEKRRRPPRKRNTSSCGLFRITSWFIGI